MCRKRALAATVLIPIITLAMAGSASAWPFGGKKDEKPAAAAPTPAPAPATPAAQSAPQMTQMTKATAAQRIEARRLEPLAAAAFWGREVEIDNRDVEANIGLSQVLRSMGRYDDAAAAGQRVLAVDPKNLGGLMEIARAYIGMGQGFYAIEPARQASLLSPRDWRPISLMAVALEQAQRDDEALAAHQRAIALAPDEPSATSNLAMFYAARGELPQAEQLLRQAVAMPRATAQVRQNLALVVGLQGRMGEAERLARQDLPPEMVASNLAWLKAATSKTAEPAAAGGRSWDAVSRPGGL